MSTFKAFGFGNEKIEASKPMTETKKNMSEIGDAPHVRIKCATLGDIIEFNGSIEFKESRKPENRN